MPPRGCILRHRGGCSDNGIAIPGSSRCRAHSGSNWHKKAPGRGVAYFDATYKANRLKVLELEPTCHWRFPGCTVRSTTADHVAALAEGGSNELSNLVGACEPCNRRRGASLGGQVTKRRRKA